MLNTKLIAVSAALLVGGLGGMPTQSEPALQSDVGYSRLGSEYDGFLCTYATAVPDADTGAQRAIEHLRSLI